MKVLLTGFEPNDDGLNASELVVNSLRSDPHSELSGYINCIDFKIMPGDTNKLGQVVAETLTSCFPDICILTGQARGRNKITLERMATNLKYFVTLDRAGNAPKGNKIVADRSTAYWSTLPNQDELVSLLEKNNIPAAISNNCGTHLCNQFFYHALHWSEMNSSAMKVGFVHIPALPEQVIKYWPESPFMSMNMTRKALSLILNKFIAK